MQYGAVTGYIDVAQLALYVFWGFFIWLIFYLRMEDKREGYPLVTEKPGERVGFFPPIPAPKTFLLPLGGSVQAPRADEQEPEFDATPVFAFPGSPLQPNGNPMLSGAGPSAYALRSTAPDRMTEDGSIRILPLRVATDHTVDEAGPNPVGMAVLGYDGVEGAVGADVWVDRAEAALRYLEVTLPAGGNVLVPMPLVTISEGAVHLASVKGKQIALAPRLSSPDQVSLREEDMIQAYFGSGHLYAEPGRMEPLI
jgi:photosynthetic reaction center H subunit